jgi:hypothetical protein
MGLDLSGDFAVFDGTETMTYRQPGRSPVTVAGVLREQLSTRELTAGAKIGLQPADVPFNLPGPNLSGVVPAGGDTITDATGVAFTVLSTSYELLTQQYRVLGRRQR